MRGCFMTGCLAALKTHAQKCTEAMLTCAVLKCNFDPEFVKDFTTFTLPSTMLVRYDNRQSDMLIAVTRHFVIKCL